MNACGNGCKRIASDDLVTLGEAERELGLKSRVLVSLDERRRAGAASDMPDPVIVARTIRLYSMGELAAWFPVRQDGRRLRHLPRANVSDNT